MPSQKLFEVNWGANLSKENNEYLGSDINYTFTNDNFEHYALIPKIEHWRYQDGCENTL